MSSRSLISSRTTHSVAGCAVERKKEAKMSRVVIEKVPTTGFQSQRTESIAMAVSRSGSQQWQRLFVGSRCSIQNHASSLV